MIQQCKIPSSKPIWNGFCIVLNSYETFHIRNKKWQQELSMERIVELWLVRLKQSEYLQAVAMHPV